MRYEHNSETARVSDGLNRGGARRTLRTIRRPIAFYLSITSFVTLAAVVSGCFGEPVQTQIVAQPAEAADVGPYKIGPDDVLEVLVWKQQQLSGRIRVGSDGTIMLPLIGQVKAAGLTTNDLQTELTTSLAKYVHDPKVTVRVFDPASRVFYVLGEVTKPGMYKLMSGEDLSGGLAAAGGPTEYANLRKIKLIRHNGDQQVEMTINYNDVSGGDMRADVPLQRGDTITVP